jgi:thymidylate kinase
MLITFSGLDGSGKTTLVRLLQASLERRDVRATVSHMYRDVGVYALGRALVGRLGRRAKRAGSGRNEGGDTAPPVIWNRSLRLLVYPLDLLLFACYRLYVEGVKGHVLIMDRYFYDTLVDVSFRRGDWRAARVLSRFTPTPSLPVLLDISPAEALARKGEHDLRFLEGKRTAYASVFPNGGRGLVLEARGDVGETLSAVEAAVLERMGGR